MGIHFLKRLTSGHSLIFHVFSRFILSFVTNEIVIRLTFRQLESWAKSCFEGDYRYLGVNSILPIATIACARRFKRRRRAVVEEANFEKERTELLREDKPISLIFARLTLCIWSDLAFRRPLLPRIR